MDELDRAVEDDSAIACFWDRYAKKRYAVSRMAGLAIDGHRRVDPPAGVQAQVWEVS